MHTTKQATTEQEAIHYDAPQHVRVIELRMQEDQALRPTRVRDNLLLLMLVGLLPLLSALVLLGLTALPVALLNWVLGS